MLLSFSLHSFLIGLGIYLGFVWTRNLDDEAGRNGSRAVFITYIVGLAFCYGLYIRSSALEADHNSVKDIDLLIGEDGQDQSEQLPFARSVESMQSGRPAQTSGVSLQMRETSTTPFHPQRVERAEEANIGIQGVSAQQNLTQALRQAAESRREVTRSEERVAALLERLALMQNVEQHGNSGDDVDEIQIAPKTHPKWPTR
jgi:hypothetical protein